MAWVRYDDQLPLNQKVTAVIMEDPGAMSLHLLANTWTASSKHPGFVPLHQPGALMADRALGAKWADLLVRTRLWHETGNLCATCDEEYADLPADLVGYVFHNHAEYRAPGRERQTPGTPADLSAKRAAAGRRGGIASGESRREQAKQPDEANEANGASKDSKPSSNSASPDPDPVPEPVVASDEATDENPSSALRADVEQICTYLADRIEANGSKRPTVTKRWRDAARLLLDTDGRTVEQVMRAIDWCQADDFWRSNVMAMPKLREKYDQLRLAAQRAGPGRAPRPSTTDERVAQGLALAAQLEAQETKELTHDAR